MHVYAADVANTITHAARNGIDATLDGVRWSRPAQRGRSR
jgi:mycothione reductase